MAIEFNNPIDKSDPRLWGCGNDLEKYDRERLNSHRSWVKRHPEIAHEFCEHARYVGGHGVLADAFCHECRAGKPDYPNNHRAG